MQTQRIDDEILLNPAQLGDWLGVTRRTVDKWRATGVGPRALRVGPRKVVYRKSDILAWLDASVVPSPAADGCLDGSQPKGRAN